MMKSLKLVAAGAIPTALLIFVLKFKFIVLAVAIVYVALWLIVFASYRKIMGRDMTVYTRIMDMLK